MIRPFPRRMAHSLHRWVGILSCLFMLIVAGTALALNHSDLWKPLFLKPVSTSIFSLDQAQLLASDPHVKGHLLAADSKALYESQDSGKNWSQLKLYLPAEKAVGLVLGPKQGQIWLALREVGVFYSDDGGEIWEEIGPLPFNPVAGEYIQKMWLGAGSALHLKTELALYIASPTGDAGLGQWQKITLVQGQGKQAIDFHDLIWRLHTGRFGGSWGILVYDAVALSLIFLSLSGLWLSRRPRHKKKLTMQRAASTQAHSESGSAV
ncbi:MAG: PepSY domain-containing protein [Candidatus Sericytochromatia bacterium]|nr:PepSY domain-containing protein [Candidatus Sericytochromatia bacterium]